MSEGFAPLLDFTNQAVSSGSVVALAAICGFQYLVHIHRRGVLEREQARLQSEMATLEGELGEVQRDRTLTRLENQILHEFVSETELNRVLGLLLKRFVPNPNEGFGSLVTFGSRSILVEQSRGLSDESRGKLRIDAALQQRVADARAVVLESSEIAQSGVLREIAHKDRGKVDRLFLVAIGDSDSLAGVLVTTSLYPEGAPIEQQLELARRLMKSITGDLRQFQAMQVQETKLRTASAVLELRAVADRHYESPLAMIDAFLNDLQSKLKVDRASIYLMNSDHPPTKRALLRCGINLQPSVLAQWNRYEDRLADLAVSHRKQIVPDRKALVSAEITSLISATIAAPLIQKDRVIGAICVSRQAETPFTSTELELAEWAVHYLSETLLRVLNHAVTERYARVDPLTGVANRRSFDARFEEELKSAHESRLDCSLILCDLDHFKSINDRFGHPAGDEVLRQAARVMQEQLLETRSSDRALLARYGGEEFAILLPGMNVSGASRIAEAIRNALESANIRFQQFEIPVTLSAGIATFPTHGNSQVEVIASADAALYQAKDAGRNRVLSPVDVLV